MTTDTSDLLCLSVTLEGHERCTAQTELSTFYTEVHAHESHGIGRLIFTGLKLTYVTDANKTEEAPPLANYNCNQTTTLFDFMDDITNAINQTSGN